MSAPGSPSIPSPGPAGPIFVAGPDRSGTTLIYALLASHPRISMVRRTNMWRYFHRRYGDLSVPEHFERCLRDMLRFRRLRHLQPNGPRIRYEFWQGEPSYGRLFALFHEHNAERVGRPRWGDKSLHTEHHADRVFAEYPDAKIIHMTRDPRDRYASVRKRHGRDRRRVGAATARWLLSVRQGLRFQASHPDGYLIVRFEDLVADPERTLVRICAFIGEPFDPAMLTMAGAPAYQERGGNSSFGDLAQGTISAAAVGRFRTVLSNAEVAFIQLVAGREMAALEYRPEPVTFEIADRVGYLVGLLPFQFMRMVGWMSVAMLSLRRGEAIPPDKLRDELLAEAGESESAIRGHDSVVTP